MPTKLDFGMSDIFNTQKNRVRNLFTIFPLIIFISITLKCYMFNILSTGLKAYWEKPTKLKNGSCKVLGGSSKAECQTNPSSCYLTVYGQP